MPKDPQDGWTPNTPWIEPRTPDCGPGHHDPVLYTPSQEHDVEYQNIDYYDL